MNRCKAAIPDFEAVLNLEYMERLFQALVAPFGREDPFSYIPRDLTIEMGRPPEDWSFITDVLEELLDSWGVLDGPPRKKQRTGATASTPAATTYKQPAPLKAKSKA